MKHHLYYTLLFFCTFIILLFSCQKDTDGNPEYKAGNMILDSLNLDSASSGKIIIVSGKNLGQVRTILFEKNNIPVSFMPTLNTDTKILFRVPDSVYGGPQNIIITNSIGNELKIPFKVIALPLTSLMFPTDFAAGSKITINGNNLEDVNDVSFEGSNEKIAILFKSRKQLIIQTPASSVTRARLIITNSSGKNTTNDALVNVDKAITIFSDQLDNGFSDIGWSGSYAPSTDDKITGTASLKAAYKAAWAVFKPNNATGVSVEDMKYLSFWVKGDNTDKNITVYVNGSNGKTIVIPANQWTYFRYELAKDYPQLKLVKSMSFQCGSDAVNTFYYDNIMFFK